MCIKTVIVLSMVVSVSAYASQSVMNAPANGNILSNCHFGYVCASPSGGKHAGVDYMASTGDGKVYMSGIGRIVDVIENGNGDHGLGNTIIAQHFLDNGDVVCSSYSHLQSIPQFVWDKLGEYQQNSTDQWVNPNTFLGNMGGTGYGAQNYWDPHLHFEIKDECVAFKDGIFGYGISMSHLESSGYFDPEDYIDQAISANSTCLHGYTNNSTFCWVYGGSDSSCSEASARYMFSWYFDDSGNQQYNFDGTVSQSQCPGSVGGAGSGLTRETIVSSGGVLSTPFGAFSGGNSGGTSSSNETPTQGTTNPDISIRKFWIREKGGSYTRAIDKTIPYGGKLVFNGKLSVKNKSPYSVNADIDYRVESTKDFDNDDTKGNGERQC